MDTHAQSLTEAVRDRIHADDRSLAELARLSGISQPFLSQFASGKPRGASGKPPTISSDLLGQLLPILGGKVVWKKPPKSGRK